MDSITVRKMQFSFEQMEPLFLEGLPEASHYNNAASFVLPYLEAFIIRAVRDALPHITCQQLRHEVELFCRQEAQHSKQHHSFNKALKKSGYPALAEMEADVKQHFQRLDKRSLKFRLGYAFGFEGLATHAAIFMFESGMMQLARGHAGEMWKWHLYEELEHRNLAYDVYCAVYGGKLYRSAMNLYALYDVGRWIVRIGNYLLQEDRQCIEQQFGGEAGRSARMQLMRQFGRETVRRLLPTLSPAYSPHRVIVPEAICRLGEKFDSAARID